MSLEVLFIYIYTCDQCGKKDEHTTDLSVTDKPKDWTAVEGGDLCPQCQKERR